MEKYLLRELKNFIKLTHILSSGAGTQIPLCFSSESLFGKLFIYFLEELSLYYSDYMYI